MSQSLIIQNHSISRFNVKKDVVIIFAALSTIFILYTIIFIRTRSIINLSVKLLARITVLAQFLIFSIEIVVWNNCAESIYVRIYGQLGFLFCYLWSRLLVTTVNNAIDDKLKLVLRYPEVLILSAYLYRVVKYVLLLSRINTNWLQRQ
ncbi:Hypothetical_protein [Hexamita inflata]|uniref:Hypothetical_protein n=1 Tax=Hexamita inflata TaxID=28002 RepID=A0AA86PV40_9EUKA|nr:Hypothetical protein HINF_LOCUS33026 [Hexamita inflata]